MNSEKLQRGQERYSNSYMDPTHAHLKDPGHSSLSGSGLPMSNFENGLARGQQRYGRKVNSTTLVEVDAQAGHWRGHGPSGEVINVWEQPFGGFVAFIGMQRVGGNGKSASPDDAYEEAFEMLMRKVKK